MATLLARCGLRRSAASACFQISCYQHGPIDIGYKSMTTAEFTCVHVFVKTKPGTEDAFREASLKNARESAKEPGISRFDVLQDKDDPNSFVLVEVYKDGDAPARHKETPHYLQWRDAVADMMAEPRQARKFVNHFPKTSIGWDYPIGKPLE